MNKHPHSPGAFSTAAIIYPRGANYGNIVVHYQL